MGNINELINKAIEAKIMDALGVDKPHLETSAGSGQEIPVIVCTDKRGVFFGYTTNPKADPITLKNARMCMWWDSKVGGVFGLADNGPNSACKISATLASGVFVGVTAVFDVTDAAVKAWVSAPTKGR